MGDSDGDAAPGGGTKLDGYVLTGGSSRRMGRDKARLRLGGDTLLGRVIGALRPVVDRCLLVGGDPGLGGPGLTFVADRWPRRAALGGIATALGHTRGRRALIVACDLPFLTPDLLRFLIRLEPSADVTLAVTEDGAHPLCAVYSRRCLPFIVERIEQDRLEVVGFFDRVTVRRVGEEELRRAGLSPDLLSNLNTPADLERARRRLAATRPGDGEPTRP